MQGRIIKILSKDYTILTEDHQILQASLAGRIRLDKRPVIGDFVIYEIKDGRVYITELLPRKNQLIRPACANVDQAIIVMSVKDPEFSTALIDRLTMLIVHENIEPILVITKTDLPYSETIKGEIQAYQNGKMRTLVSDKAHFKEEIGHILAGKVTVLTGQSGAGKSSLLNKLNPLFQLKTQEISKALGRGKHTTRHSELLQIYDGLVADTPGFSSLDFHAISEKELAGCVPDFRPLLGQCRFSDCRHEKEPGCAIKQAVMHKEIAESRYQNYVNVLSLIRNEREIYS